MLQKKVTKEKGSLKSFLGFSIFSAVRAIQLVAPINRVSSYSIAWSALRFSASKMSIFFQKRFGGVFRLAAIWVLILLFL
jgi:hypothetical protein